MNDLVKNMDVVKAWFPNKSFPEPPIPSAKEWLANMSVMHVWCLSMSSIFVFITFALACVHLYFVMKYVSNERIRNDLYSLILMYPITNFCSVMGMFIPRAAVFLYAVALVYFMFTLFVLVTVLFNIFGGRQEMSTYLLQRNVKIKLTMVPLCLCKCIPMVESTNANLRRIEWLVFQTPVIRTCLELTSVAVSMEQGGRRESIWFVFSQLCGLISMCIAFYGCYVMVPLGREKHDPYQFIWLFRICDVAQCLYTIQKFVFEFAAAVGIIASDRFLPATSKALWWTSFMITWQMMLLSALTSYLMRPMKCKFFDLYPTNDRPQIHPRMLRNDDGSAGNSTETLQSSRSEGASAPKTSSVEFAGRGQFDSL